MVLPLSQGESMTGTSFSLRLRLVDHCRGIALVFKITGWLIMIVLNPLARCPGLLAGIRRKRAGPLNGHFSFERVNYKN